MIACKYKGKEYPPPSEAEAIQKLREVLTRDQYTKPGSWRRGQHPTHQGCVWANFIVDKSIPDEIKVGAFKRAHTFKALIRFSNGQTDDDRNQDVHGMAIKLLEVEGDKILEDEKQTQDFILVDHPVFFAKNVQHMLDFVLARDSGAPMEQIIKTHPKLIGFVKPPPPSPLENRYWSQTPYLLGRNAVRYSVIPSEVNSYGRSAGDSEHFLREAMIDWLTYNNKEAHFDFFIQIQTNPDTMDIEDPTIEWDEKESIPIKVATVVIPPQKFDSPGQLAFCEALSYTPWHCLPEHQPLGGINRARRYIYEDSSNLRHKKVEPTGKEEF